MAAMNLKSYEFRKEREATWTELEDFLDRIEKKGLRSLSASELVRLPILYRATVSSLSVARTISLDRNVLEYLEALAGRAYFCVYGTRRGVREIIGEFICKRLPARVREFWRYIAVASLIMFLGVAVGFALTLAEPDRFYSFVSPEYAGGRGPSASTESLESTLYSSNHSDDELAAFSAGLFSHNAKIGMFCFALGFLAGLPVIILLFQNGLLLGAFAAVFHSRGLSVDFWGWVLPHGVTEIFALILCGAAGLVMGHSLLAPGRFSRLENLARRGRMAGQVVLGAVFMFLIAGLIEGIFRQTVTSVSVRYVVLLGSAAVLSVYFGFVGRADE